MPPPGTPLPQPGLGRGKPSSAGATPPHPPGLATLFLTEMWERFSYYGMRALLVLFMVDQARGGLGLDDKTATAIYGLYTAAVYLTSLPGGWLADRWLGAQRAVWYGGMVIALGHFTLAIPRAETFYPGLVLVAVGSGILKPNMSAMVADLYPETGARRDAGFTIFYMGVNLGAFLGPLVCSTLGEKINWHYGFGAAGVGMVLGLVQFRLTRGRLGAAGRQRGNDRPLNAAERGALLGFGAAAVLLVVGSLTGVVPLYAVTLAHGLTTVILGLGALYFAGLFWLGRLTTLEKKRIAVILILFLASALFWSGFEQAGSSFTLFAERMTNRRWLTFEIPAGWYQSLGALFIIAFAPLFSWLWVRLARRNWEPSITGKFAFGLLLLASGFLVMAGAATVVAAGGRAAPTWLITTYLLHTFGELCLSPVGLSAVTQLAPRKLVGQMMGVWFLATSLGNLLAGLQAGSFGADRVAGWPALYLKIALPPAIAGLLLLLFARPIKQLMTGETRGRV